MFNLASIDACRSGNYGSVGQFRLPHDQYNNARITGSIVHLLTGEEQDRLPDSCFGTFGTRAERVVCIFSDGTLFKLIESACAAVKEFGALLDSATVSMLTSQFPSNTVPHVVTMNTGLSVAQHACPEWTIRLPEHGSPIKPFRGVDTNDRPLASFGIAPSRYFPQESFYQKLARRGLSSAVVSWNWMERSQVNAWFQRGARFLGYQNPADLIVTLPQFLEQEDPAYTYVYLETPDEIGHLLGPDSPEAEREYNRYFKLLASIVQRIRQDNRMILLMADHGQVPINLRWPASTICLDGELENISDLFIEGPDKKPFFYTGGCRDAFLHIKESCLNYAREVLSSKLAGRAEVVLVDTLLRDGVFGSLPPAAEFRERIGNLAVLPYAGFAVTMKGYRQEEVPQRGYHGGMCPDEMEVPFIVLR